MNGSPFPKFQPMFQGRFSNPLWDSGWYLKEFTAAARFICPPTFLVASIRFTPSMQMRRVIQEWMIPRWMPDSMLNMGLQIISRRSEEHTSELQSRGHLVCRLLLEKKKTKITSKHNKYS